MVEPLRHRQTKEAETDMFSLQPPRHIPTLPKVGRTQHEQMSSGLPLIADIAQCGQQVSKVPTTNSCTAANSIVIHHLVCSIILRWTSTALRSASTALENSISRPSPVVLTMRP